MSDREIGSGDWWDVLVETRAPPMVLVSSLLVDVFWLYTLYRWWPLSQEASMVMATTCGVAIGTTLVIAGRIGNYHRKDDSRTSAGGSRD